MAMNWARFTALAVSVGTFVFLFLHDSWRADNLFLIPDLILCAALLAAALLPRAAAVPALLISLGFSAGVLSTSVASYLTRGELGVASLIGALACIAAAGWLSTDYRTAKP